MLNKNNFFNEFYFNKRIYKKNFTLAKKNFEQLKKEIYNLEIPLLRSFEKSYELDFSVNKIRKNNKYKNIIIIGMGGSILGTKSIYSFLKKKIRKKVFFFDNLDTFLHDHFRKIKNLNNSSFIVISKSGNTLETIVNLNLISKKISLKNKLIIITEFKDSALMSLAKKYNAEIVEHKNFIGGRYSVMSEAGMLPSLLMGLNINNFKNLKMLINNDTFASSLIKNVACMYYLNKKGYKNSVILNYHSSLNDLCFWYQQLIGESLGKKGRGINPNVSFGPKDHHSVLQLYLDGPKDKFFTFINFDEKKKSKYKLSGSNLSKDLNFLKNKDLNFIIKAQLDATINVFKKKNIPYRKIILKKDNEEQLGIFFTFFVLETLLIAKLIKVNPFDQPDVEQIKLETKKFLLK